MISEEPMHALQQEYRSILELEIKGKEYGYEGNQKNKNYLYHGTVY